MKVKFVQRSDGPIFNYHAHLAARPDMKVIEREVDVTKRQAAKAKQEAEQTAEQTPDASASVDGEASASTDIDIDTATKAQLEAYARANLDLELDRRKSVDSLRQQVRNALGGE